MSMWNKHIHTDTENVHKCSYAYRNPKNTKLVQVRKFLLLFEFKVFRHEERETQFLQQTHGIFRRPPTKKNRLPSSRLESQLTTIFQIPKSSARRFRAWRHSRPWSYFLSGVLIVTSLIVTSFPRAREYLHSMCAPN